jgi:hypothetical protein
MPANMNWKRRLRAKLVRDLTPEELWWLRDFNERDGGGGPEFLQMCLPWVHAKSMNLPANDMTVGQLVAILQLAWTQATAQLMFERRANKNRTPAEAVGMFLKNLHPQPRASSPACLSRSRVNPHAPERIHPLPAGPRQSVRVRGLRSFVAEYLIKSVSPCSLDQHPSCSMIAGLGNGAFWRKISLYGVKIEADCAA